MIFGEEFERALDALLAGQPVDDTLQPRTAGGDPALDALRVLSVVGRTSRSALFGDGAVPVETRRWGHLEIREEIGRGTSGTVYRAWDARLAREVALKLFDPDSALAGAALAEGRLLARLRHPHIVTVYGADTFDGVSGLWMELVQGDSLDELVERDGPMAVEEALLTGIDLAGALAAVHASGMLHRDVKARNVVRQRGGRLVLMDFGAGGGAGLEGAGHAVGTPMYMAPEVLDGAPASAESDVYGLGVLLFHLLTGAYPVEAKDLTALRAAHATGARRTLAALRADVPAEARAVIERACAQEPRARHESASAVEVALRQALGPVLDRQAPVVPSAVRRWRQWKRSVAVVAATVASVLLTIGLGWNTPPGRAVRRAAGLAVPPMSPLYLTFDGGLAVLDGARVRLLAGGSPGAHALAVAEQWGIRTMASHPPWIGGAWLALDGTPRPAAPAAAALCCFQDGTTDGRFNYALRQDSTLLDPIGSRALAPPAVYRFGPDWRDGQALFELGASASDITRTLYYGITFHGPTRTFWVTRADPDGTAHAERWSVDGRRQAVVPLQPHSFGIAADPADGTLWVFRDEGDDPRIYLDNLDASGAFLGTLPVERPVDTVRPAAKFASGLEFPYRDRP